jgi:tetratricopeptide (TPR) repeat protein
MKRFFNNLIGNKHIPPKNQKRNELMRKSESQCEADEFYKKGDLIGGEFEVVGNLGKGGFGLVYRVRHFKTGAEFALKTFRDEFLDDPKARDAFKKEALLWVNLENHPFILSATVVLEVSGRLFVFMEYIAPDEQGRVNLADHLTQTVDPLDLRCILGWAIQFCLGMEHAQAHGIRCHRDIKPANIFITQNGTLQIGDFGLSRAAETAWRQSHTQNGSLIKGNAELGFSFGLMQSDGKFRSGTPGYIAPEVYRFEGADIRSDIYSFGLVLWQMVTGSQVPPFMVPWRGDMEKFLHGIYEQQMTGHAPQMSGSLTLIIDRCLRPNPSERFGSFRELRKLLEPIFEETTGRKFEKPQIGRQTVDLWHKKGVSFSALKRHKEAIVCYDRVLQIDPRYTFAWIGKGVALDELGQYEEAIGCYDKALTIDPRDATAWSNKGAALVDIHRLQEAINCYDKALAIDPQNIHAWSNKAGVLRALDRYEEAIICHEKALAIDSRFVNAWTGKANALCELGRHNEAVSCYGQALAINPRDAETWTRKGTAFHVLGQHKEEIDCFNKATEVDPLFALAWALKGAVLDEQGQGEEALGCYNKALAIDPRNIIVWNNKGNLLSKLGRCAEAIECYDKALTISPQSTNV